MSMLPVCLQHAYSQFLPSVIPLAALTSTEVPAAIGSQEQKIHEADAPKYEVTPVHQDYQDRQGDTDGLHLAREYEPKGQGCPMANASC